MLDATSARTPSSPNQKEWIRGEKTDRPFDTGRISAADGTESPVVVFQPSGDTLGVGGGGGGGSGRAGEKALDTQSCGSKVWNYTWKGTVIAIVALGLAAAIYGVANNPEAVGNWFVDNKGAILTGAALVTVVALGALMLRNARDDEGKLKAWGRAGLFALITAAAAIGIAATVKDHYDLVSQGFDNLPAVFLGEVATTAVLILALYIKSKYDERKETKRKENENFLKIAQDASALISGASGSSWPPPPPPGPPPATAFATPAAEPAAAAATVVDVTAADAEDPNIS